MLIVDMFTPSGRSRLTVVLSCALALPLTLTGCNHGPSTAADAANLAEQQRLALDSARQQLDMIPPPSKSRYMAVRSLGSWENPYLTVQGDMVSLHVLLADSNPSEIGQGGLLRPVGARRRNLDVRLNDLPTALNAIPSSSWPYGRVLAVEEAHDVPPAARAGVRRNVEAVYKTLGDLGIVVYEWNEPGRGL
ncbi:MAG: hypothetical protein PW789_06005 [Edaphobacter sp.]|uniref:hypothetical protein n=1 Tax=Edaphobacter sp. TaxID=1934404 RepID=UPI002399C2EE|nr:hypothetical protein [Edaphobacter sp.]MDE1176146.1 hypothetical protein [Edaphobacter sp.]